MSDREQHTALTRSIIRRRNRSGIFALLKLGLVAILFAWGLKQGVEGGTVEGAPPQAKDQCRSATDEDLAFYFQNGEYEKADYLIKHCEKFQRTAAQFEGTYGAP